MKLLLCFAVTTLLLASSAYSEDSLDFIWPVKGVITQYYDGSYDGHAAIDITTRRGTPIVAVEDGKVTQSKYNGRLGNIVTIKHANGFESFYAHSDDVYVSKGQTVEKGEPISTMGNTGSWSTGVHLHFEIIKNGKQVDPINYLP